MAPTLDVDVRLDESSAEPVEVRLKRAFADHYELVWRLLRRFGVAESTVDDAAQEVFVVLARRIDGVRAGSERSFLFGTALRVARRERTRAQKARDTEPLDTAIADERGLEPDALYEERRARALCDEILSKLDDDARTAFVLFEVEGLTVTEIAELLEVPRGTIASRVRRAREEFCAHVKRIKAGLDFTGGSR